MVVNRLTARWLRWIFTCLALAGLAFLGGCGGGSGAPNNPFKPVPPPPTAVTILPAVSTAYSNTPATLTVAGGVPPYFVTSSNSAILPVAQANVTGIVVLLPANVVSNTAVTITAVDSIGQVANATVTVNPAPIFNTLTITPNSNTCGPNSVCSGQTATASVTVTGPGGAGIPNRQVRFDVVAGAFSIETTDPANPLVSTLTVVSDQFGVAKVILQAAANAFTQPALLRATELTTGNQQTVQFTIVQTTNGSAVLSVVPNTATITGPDANTCSSGFQIDYYIYGGTPPYRVTSTFPNSVVLQNVPVTVSGGHFTAITNGACVNPLVFSIFDAVGLQTTATLINNVGTGTPPAPSTLSLIPGSYSQVGCTSSTQFTFIVVGGTPPYNVSATNATPNPQVLNKPGDSTTITWPGGTGTASVVVIDSSSPQQSATSTITCS
jgi:hypothetical protein